MRSVWEASSRVVAFPIPVCRLLSVTSLTNSLVHRRVSHLLSAEGSPQDRRCRPPGVSDAASPGRQTSTSRCRSALLLISPPSAPAMIISSSGGPLIHSPLGVIFPAIPDDCGGEQTGNARRR